MKKIVLLGLCICSVILVFGQQPVNVVFTYDNNGNRIGREILFARAGDDDNDTLMEQELLTSVSDSFDTVEVSVFPNPTNDKVFVATKGLDSDRPMRAVLISPTGKALEERTVTSSAESFDLSGKASGVYLLELTVDRERHLWKVIKK